MKRFIDVMDSSSLNGIDVGGDGIGEKKTIAEISSLVRVINNHAEILKGLTRDRSCGGVMFRPMKGYTIDESMSCAREFISLGELIKTLIDEHNAQFPYFKIRATDLVVSYYGADERIGWRDCFIITYNSYPAISNKDGYERFFGGSKSKTPSGVVGWFSTDYDREPNFKKEEETLSGSQE